MPRFKNTARRAGSIKVRRKMLAPFPNKFKIDARSKKFNLARTRSDLSTYGFAVIPGVLTPPEILSFQDGLWTAFEYKTGVKRADPLTYDRVWNLHPIRGYSHQFGGIGHGQFAWDVRQNPALASIWADLIACPITDLLVSQEGIEFNPGPRMTNRRGFDGGSSCMYLARESAGYRGLVTGFPIGPGDGTLKILLGSHLLHEQFAAEFGVTRSRHRLTREQIAWYKKTKGCKSFKIHASAGSLILWDKRAVYSGRQFSRDRATNIRGCVPVTYENKRLATRTTCKIRRAAYRQERTLGYAGDVKPSTPSPLVRPWTPPPRFPHPPSLTALGRMLCGLQ